MSAQPDLFDRPHIDTSSLCGGTDEKVVASILNQCVGAANAIQVKHVAGMAGVPGRKVQSIVRHLIVEHGAPIGTSMREPFGWFLAATAEEVAAVVELHRSRALSELQTMAKLKNTGLRAVLAQIQTELEVA